MRDQPCGTYSVKSHCFQLLRYHKHDWLMIVGLLITEIVLNVIHPFRRFVGKDMMTDLRYPLKSNTVPVWSVPLYAVLLPILIFLIYYFRKRNVNDLHHAVLGLLFAVFITGVITDAIKDGVGRPRPDFFWRCFPDGKDLYDNVTTNVICHGDPAVIKEGHKSFPSGHTSWSFAGLGYLSLYLAGKIKIFDQRGHAAKLCIVCFPLLAAAMVGVSRVDDYWHHWQDVFAGALIGLIMATLCYRQFFPAPYDSEGFGPYSYFQIITDALVPEMDNANGQQNSAQDSQPELPHFTMNGERAIETRNMEQAIEIRNMEQAIEIRNIQGRGDRPLFDIETARSRELVVENNPSEAFIGRKASTVKRNPFEESMERKGSNGKGNPFDVIVERRGTLGKGNPFDVK